MFRLWILQTLAKGEWSQGLTVDEDNRLLDGMLVTELGVEEGTADKRAVISGLVPAHMQMVDVDVTQASHHLHLVLDWRDRE